ncbi:MAG: cell adhesion domain protein [Gemmatimonadetes bacterium]|nr:cell adhesion domain protein [Gemmatimonadota bacterium]
MGAYTPKLTVADAKTGAVVYEIADPHFNWDGWSMNTAPVLGDANDVIDAQGGRLLSFDLAKRQIAWEVTGGFTGQPSVANGVVYVAKSGQVEAHREADGGLLWTWVPPQGAVTGPMIVTNNILLVATAAATYVIDLGTHGTTWSYPAGGQLAISKFGTLFIAQATGKLTSIKLR